MRPVHTQTEPIKDFVCDLEPKAWVCSSSGLISHHSTLKVSCDAGTSTSDVTSLTQASSKSCSSPHKRNCSCGGENSNEQLTAEAKTAVLNSTATSPTSPVSPFISSSLPGQSIEDNNINTGTNTSPKLSDAMATATINADSTPTSMSCTVSMESNEIVQLRQQNALLQAQLASLQRDLVAETRARMRTVIAMQDTREKFEMLSAMAYKKLKEMIFQRHVLEMKVRELRAQVDVQSSQGGMLLRHEQMQLQQLAQFQYQAAT
ncbi:hypothetical protein BCR41DRAFT_364060 [Lobosporangium transversale]|uniref:Uncharacterized protein n=1 Tax=Lobosporangium transversale TaxID=64571 RepID=A0A1Y2G9J0_9FUNG|nr:hypothetical protein BCR41DRAFT_364060 [Lobosporangium transversale]ORY99540.1 hypothetical protein BCR41DRAFT_364060 [Lobosporangium transversale]|eukprot:XP_021875866.1 hypothetical protein BCR41DRAFT_364060 [Lobosporangium transversale]